MGNIEIKKMCETRAFYEFKDKNKKGEKIVVEITKVFPELTKGSLPMLWKEHGFTKKLYTSYLCADVYVTNEEGNCYGKYNPTVKPSKDGKRYVINFDWMLEVSDENIEKILKEVNRLAFVEVCR